MIGVGHVELDDLGLRGKPARGALREAHGPTERAEDDLGALLLGELGDRVGDRSVVEHSGHEDALTVEDHVDSEGREGLRAPA